VRCDRLGYVCEYPAPKAPTARITSKSLLRRPTEAPAIPSPNFETLAAFQGFDLHSPFIDGSLHMMNYDPLFGALTAGSSMPHMSHDAFHLHMNPPSPQVRDWPQFSFSALLPDLFAGGQNQTWLTSRFKCTRLTRPIQLAARRLRHRHLALRPSRRPPQALRRAQRAAQASAAARHSLRRRLLLVPAPAHPARQALPGKGHPGRV
jgi:hypothetical protein